MQARLTRKLMAMVLGGALFTAIPAVAGADDAATLQGTEQAAYLDGLKRLYLTDNERNLLTLRALAFSLFPLLLGLQHVKLAAQPLTRKTLRPMFYARCYVTVPFVFAVDLALLCGKLPFDGAGTLGTAIFGAGEEREDDRDVGRDGDERIELAVGDDPAASQ